MYKSSEKIIENIEKKKIQFKSMYIIMYTVNEGVKKVIIFNLSSYKAKVTYTQYYFYNVCFIIYWIFTDKNTLAVWVNGEQVEVEVIIFII